MAHGTPSIPLDLGFGAGHLNVSNALTNFEPGEYGPGNVPLLGWDYGSIGGQGSTVDYDFNAPTSGWIAITLIWDRVVELTNPDGSYSFGDDFFNNSIAMELTNLDLLLLDSNDNAIRASVAAEDGVEHIFWEIPSEGNYTIRVSNSGDGAGDGQDYGLAWWAGELPKPGDFDNDGDVDGNDFMEWQRGNSPDPLSAGDLGDWQSNYGTPLVAASQAAPEPTSLSLLATSLAILLFHRRTVPIT